MRRRSRSLWLGLGLAASLVAALLGAQIQTRADWSAGPSLASGRQYQSTVVLDDGRVLVAGGQSQSNTPALASAEIYDPNANVWNSAGTMTVARFQAIAALLPNGKVLVAGGYGTGPLASAEIYDPQTNGWSAAASMGAARYLAASAVLQSGKVLVVGGYDGTTTLSSAEIYDPSLNTWSPAGTMTTPRQGFAAIPVSGGDVLVMGGTNLSTVAISSAERYNPTTNSWSSAGNMATARYFLMAVALASGKALVMGGRGPSLTFLASAEVYDPATGWRSVAPMISARDGGAVALMLNGTVLVAGGSDQTSILSNVESYDPLANTWTSQPSLAQPRSFGNAELLRDGRVLVVGGMDPVGVSGTELYAAPTPGTAKADSLNVARWGHVAVRLDDGRVLVAGGVTPTTSHTTSAELYDPVMNSWSPAASMQDERSYFAAVKLKTGGVFVVGGFGGLPSSPDFLASAEIYDPDSDVWAAVPPMSTPRENLTATLLPSGKVLVAGGDNVNGAVATTQVYDPSTNGWSDAGLLSHPRTNPVAILLKTGKVLLTGGIDPSVQVGLSSSELYDPAANAWSAAASMSFGRDHPLAARLIDGRVLVAGGFLNSTLPDVRQAETYDPVSNSWSAAGSMIADRTLSTGGPGATATVLPGGNVLVTGGANTTGDTLQTAEEYQPTTNSWVVAPALQTPRIAQTATLLQDGRVLIAGGGGNSPWLASCELYPAQNPVSVSNYLFDPKVRLTTRGQGVIWTFIQGTHTVVDSANLGGGLGAPAPLFSSGTLAVGKSFVYDFVAAGTYKYASTAGEPIAMSGTVSVPVTIQLARDGSKRLLIIWSQRDLPGYVYDAQTRFAPAGGTFGAWAKWGPPTGGSDWETLASLFAPSTKGTYQFRADLKNAATGNHSGWSPVSTFTVR